MTVQAPTVRRPLVVLLGGEVDAWSSSRLERRIRTLDVRAADVVVDGRGITRVDHVGLAMLQRTVSEWLAVATSVRLVVPPAVASVVARAARPLLPILEIAPAAAVDADYAGCAAPQR